MQSKHIKHIKELVIDTPGVEDIFEIKTQYMTNHDVKLYVAFKYAP